MINFEILGTEFKVDDNCELSRFYSQTKRWKNISKNKKSKCGYINVGLFDSGKHKLIPIHRVIYYAFNPDYDLSNTAVGNSIVHIDKNKDNNHIKNLEIMKFTSS